MTSIDNATGQSAITQQAAPAGFEQRPADTAMMWLAYLWKGVVRILRVRQGRRQLLEMEPRLLADIGLSRADALVEAARPWWHLTPSPPDATRRRR